MPEPSYFALHYLVVAKSPGARIIRSENVNERIDVRDGYKRFFDLSVIISTHTLLCPRGLIVCIFVPLAIRLEERGAGRHQACLFRA